ncbi:hypothetical protein AX16_008328 [Volvariella volvacea WC 439]|nr:hypothetical protein AX16_008328 [Volvariella volvacea WC 439]
MDMDRDMDMDIVNFNPVEQDLDSDDEMDWEEVKVPERHIEITLDTRPSGSKGKEGAPTKKGISYAERVLRIDCHKVHTIALLGNAWVRNKWINDPLLHARLISLTPLALQNEFSKIHKSLIPDQNQRGRMFENAMKKLVDWWCGTYFEVTDGGHIRNRTFDDVQRKLVEGGYVPQDAIVDNKEKEKEDIKGKGKEKDPPVFVPLDEEALQDLLDDDGERIRSPKSLMKHALNASGSRDTSAQLFTALCRALGIPARLVVSLQSVPWQSSIGKPKPTYSRKTKKGKSNDAAKGKTKAEDAPNASEEDEDDMKEISIVPSSPHDSTSELDKKGKGKGKGKGKASIRTDDRNSTPMASSSSSSPLKSEKAKGKEKAKPVIKLRKSSKMARAPATASASPAASGTSTPRSIGSATSYLSPQVTPPVFWTEVFSRPDARWLPVDPIRGIVNRRKVFDPSPTSITAPQHQVLGSIRYPHPYAPKRPSLNTAVPRSVSQENRMVYVIALEEDGYGRDVTRRYAKEFSAKISKMQGGNIGTGAGGKGRTIWWEHVVQSITRPFRLHRDDVEDEELETAQLMEGMPTTIAGFKDHPLYVLTRHLKQNETIHPPPPGTPELGKFRGEPVYPRSSVVSLKTAENWMRSEGRVVSQGSQPLKMVKVKAGTVNKMRELEVLKDEMREARKGEGESSTSGGGDEIMQGLYARSQTEPYVPDPVIDGIVPKNNFGNIDLYVPSMLPEGAVHLPYKGIAKIARKLGIDHAEAVVGFEFRKRRALPVIEGVVVARENESLLLEAYWAAEQDAEEKARIKREDRILKQWTRLIQGLRVRKRLQEQYAKPKGKGEEQEKQQIATEPQLQSQLHPKQPPPKGSDIQIDTLDGGDAVQDAESSHTLDASTREGGGFLVEAGDVVQAFHLPKQYLYDTEGLSDPRTLPKAPNAPTSGLNPGEGDGGDLEKRPRFDITYDLDPLDLEEEDNHLGSGGGVLPSEPAVNARPAPKTMQEIAEAEERRRLEEQKEGDVEELADMVVDKVGTSSSPMTPGSLDTGVGTRRRRSIPKTNGRSSAVNSKNGSKCGTPVDNKKSSAANNARRKRRRKDESSEAEDKVDEEHLTDDGDDQPSGPPAKRTRKEKNMTAGRTNTAAASSTVTPARTLRPRAAKNRVKVQEEEDLDDLLDHLE